MKLFKTLSTNLDTMLATKQVHAPNVHGKSSDHMDELTINYQGEGYQAIRQWEVLAHPYSNRNMAILLFPAVFAHILKLIKAILLFALTFTAYTLTWLYNPKLDPADKDSEKVSSLIWQCTLQELILIIDHVANIALALITPVVRGIRSLNGYDSEMTAIDQKIVHDTWNLISPVDHSFMSNEVTIQFNH